MDQLQYVDYADSFVHEWLDCSFQVHTLVSFLSVATSQMHILPLWK
jgi:hypothetical protein